MAPWLALIYSVVQTSCPGDGGVTRTVALPRQSGNTSATVILRGLERPAARPIILRLYAVGKGNDCVYLGSAGLEATSPSATTVRTQAVPVAVTTGLNRWIAAHPDRDSVCIRIVAFDAGNKPARELVWKVERVEIVR